MIICKIVGATRETVQTKLLHAILESRFTANLEYKWVAKGDGIKITTVRLRGSKEYCGNHAKACERAISGRHRKTRFLEGADWVEFNDLVNNVLDEMNVEAFFYSQPQAGNGKMILRDGANRRLAYRADKFIGQPGNGEWVWNLTETTEHYTDYRGKKAPPSSFPDGTPGIYVAIGYDVEG